jgi:hypothetical protein
LPKFETRAQRIEAPDFSKDNGLQDFAQKVGLFGYQPRRVPLLGRTGSNNEVEIPRAAKQWHTARDFVEGNSS